MLPWWFFSSKNLLYYSIKIKGSALYLCYAWSIYNISPRQNETAASRGWGNSMWEEIKFRSKRPYILLAMNYSCQWDTLRNRWGCVMSCEWPHGIGAPRLFHVGDKLWLKSTLCTTLGSPLRWPVHWTNAWATLRGLLLVLAHAPLLTVAPPFPSQRAWPGGNLAFSSKRNLWLCLLPRSWAGEAARSLATVAGCQAPVQGNAFPVLNGRKRWCEGNTLCCRRGGAKAACHPQYLCTHCFTQLGNCEAALRNAPRSEPAALAFADPPCVAKSTVVGVGWITGPGLLWGVYAACLLSASPAVNLWSYSLPFPLPHAAVENRSLSSWGLWFSVIQKYTSHHASLVPLLLLPIQALLESLHLPGPCLIFLAGETCWKQAVPWAVSYGLAWTLLCLLSCKFHLKQFSMNRTFRASLPGMASPVSSKGWALTVAHVSLGSLIGLSPFPAAFMWNVWELNFSSPSYERGRNRPVAQQQLGKEGKKVMWSTDPGFLRKPAQKQDECIFRKRLTVLSPLW